MKREAFQGVAAAVAAIQSILIEKGICTDEELTAEMDEMLEGIKQQSQKNRDNEVEDFYVGVSSMSGKSRDDINKTMQAMFGKDLHEMFGM